MPLDYYGNPQEITPTIQLLKNQADENNRVQRRFRHYPPLTTKCLSNLLKYEAQAVIEEKIGHYRLTFHVNGVGVTNKPITHDNLVIHLLAAAAELEQQPGTASVDWVIEEAKL